MGKRKEGREGRSLTRGTLISNIIHSFIYLFIYLFIYSYSRAGGFLLLFPLFRDVRVFLQLFTHSTCRERERKMRSNREKEREKRVVMTWGMSETLTKQFH
jgi:hypothetical protein